jgi:hypothetical protein
MKFSQEACCIEISGSIETGFTARSRHKRLPSNERQAIFSATEAMLANPTEMWTKSPAERAAPHGSSSPNVPSSHATGPTVM